MQDYIQHILQWLTIDPQDMIGLFIQVFVVVFLALLLDLMQKRLVARIQRRALKTPTVWDDAILSAMSRPISVLLWLLGITFAADIIGGTTQVEIFQAAPSVRDLGIIIIISWFLIRFINNAEANIIQRITQKSSTLDRTTVDALAKLVRASVIIATLLVGLQNFGFSISGVLAFGGIGGIVVGLAAKDMLANFFGGLMIYLDRPFAVDDWIRSPDREIEGIVEHIGWRQTCIRTFDKRPLYVPNSTFANIAVENPSRMTHRRIYETMGIRYSDASRMGMVINDIKTMLGTHPDIDQERTIIVNFNKFAASSLDFFIYAFTRTTDWIEYHAIKQDVLLKIINIVEQHGAEFAFPTSTLHVAKSANPPEDSDANTPDIPGSLDRSG